MKKLLAQILILAIAIPAWTAGCYKRVEIPRERLTDNANFGEKGGPYYVQPKTAWEAGAPLKTLSVQNGTLIGELKDHNKPGQTKYQLDDVKRVQKKEFSPGITALAVLGGILGAFAAIGMTFAIGMSTSNCCGS
jgi:hypothetical protein